MALLADAFNRHPPGWGHGPMPQQSRSASTPDLIPSPRPFERIMIRNLIGTL
jgi:hypothetical protein